jgi:hypothetical protein
MVWTTPKDWVPAVLSSSELDSQLSGNMLHLSTHTHDGSAGNGSAAILGNLTGTPNRLWYTGAAGLLVPLAFGASGQVLRFNGPTSAPSAGGLSGLAGTNAHRLLYLDGSAAIAELPYAGLGSALVGQGLTTPPIFQAISANFFSHVDYTWMPDAGAGSTILAGDQQGFVLHSGPLTETPLQLFMDAETAGTVPVTIEYGNSNDLDDVTAWTTIVTGTLPNVKSASTTSMSVGSIPGARLLRMNIGTIGGTPKDLTVTLRVKRPVVGVV